MNTDSSSAHARALVLGGGGAAGNAWLIGVIAGLSDAGVEAADAELIVGTSAGATAAAQVTSAPIAELFDAVLQPVPQRQAPPRGSGGRPAAFNQSDHLERLRCIIASADSAADMRRKIGAAALEADAGADPSAAARWRATVAARLPRQEWPERSIRITAVDPVTGDGVVFDRNSGVELADAVAASTSNGFGLPPYRIGERRFIDGGYRRNENADLAAGFERVLVLSPLGGRTLHPLEWGMQLAAQVDELRAGGSRVETILPDAASLDAFGGNMMNLAARPAAARAGFEQGRSVAVRLTGFWS
ncbi:patatin-like phospholipase family protein [Gryllotalpicola protaetiae]|uniref:Patatin-like phospholipase family protein n=1 Tax=Gryllotalpicola protaetiae TaxID=2419771 RepID=A0A387BSV1_9MICO|nr:patatin-like phospholipase family protein [Gryllotalpicola protaetiae]AYG04139.1 patatin-like phospholipase family protein [Gryllotalpicola protaetiae]